MNEIDVYDFDGTIYNGDSSFDFIKYCIKTNKKLILHLPKIFIFFILYIFKIISLKKFKETCFEIISNIDVDKTVNLFWEKNSHKINNFFIKNMEEKKQTYVISASPEFLLKEYLSKYKNIKLIGTKMDKKGKITGNNCKGYEKINLLNKKEKNYKIKNFYSDSLNDLPLVSISQNSFYVNKGSVSTWDCDHIRKKKDNKIALLIGILAFIIYFIYGFVLTIGFDFSNCYDLIFDSDTARVIQDITDPLKNHYRINVHPLFVLLMQPIYFILKAIFLSKPCTLVMLSSLVSSISVYFIYKFLSIYNTNTVKKVLITIIFILSFSNIIFTSTIELYNISALFLILLWYFVALKLNSNEKITKYDYIILGILGLMNMSIIVTNFIVYIIAIFILFISKKFTFSKISITTILVGVSLIGLSYFQNIVWHNTPIITNAYYEYSYEKNYIYDIPFINRVKKVATDDYFNIIIGSDTTIKKYVNDTIEFKGISIINFVVALIILIQTIVGIIKNIKFKKYTLINIGLIITLLFNTIFHIIYGNNGAYLYSLHFLYDIILLYGINTINTNNKVYKYFSNIFLFILILLELIINNTIIYQIIKILRKYIPTTFFLKKMSIITNIIIAFVVVCLFLSFMYLLYIFVRNAIKSNKEKRIAYIVLSIMIIILNSCMFMTIYLAPTYNKILFFNIK